MAEAGLDVRQPVVLLGRRPQRLREQRDAVERDRQLARARAYDRAVGADQVSQVERAQAVERLLPEHVEPPEQLDAPGAVEEVGEDRLALTALGRQPTSDAHALVGLASGLEVVVPLARGGDRHHAREGVRERVHAGRAQLLELAPPRRDDLGLTAAD